MSSASLLQVALNGAAAVFATLVLGASDRGLMVLALTISSVSAVLGNAGTGAALRRYLPVHEEPADRHALVTAYWWCSAVGAVVACLLAALVSTSSAAVIDRGLASPAFVAAVVVFTVEQCLLLQGTEIWFADGEFRRGGLTGVTVVSASVLGILVAASVTESPTSLVLGQGIGGVVAWFVRVPALRRRGLLVPGRPRWHDVKKLVGGGLPTLCATIGLAVALRCDRYVLGAVHGPAAVGVYSLAATLSEVARMVPQAVGQLVMRDAAARGADRSPPRQIGVALVAAVVGGAVVAVASWFLIGPVFGAEFAGAAPVLVVLVVAEVCFAPYAVSSRGLLGGGRVRSAALLGAAASLTAPLAYLVGVTWAGTVGLAVACVAVYAALSVGGHLLYRRAGPATADG